MIDYDFVKIFSCVYREKFEIWKFRYSNGVVTT